MNLGDFDTSGRRKPIDREGDDFLIEADQVISAVGQKVDVASVFDGVSRGSAARASR
jgi:NADPH-dependent glutamate synthase beta subunit-like oxidoreductase